MAAPCPQLLTSGPLPFCLCRSFSCKAYPGTNCPTSIGRPTIVNRSSRSLVRIKCGLVCLTDMPCLQGRICDGTLVSSQERRAAVTPRINWLSTGRFVPPPVYIGFPLFVLPKNSSGQCSSMPWRAKGTVVSLANRPVDVPSCPAPSRPATPPRAASPRPARGMSGFWIRHSRIRFA